MPSLIINFVMMTLAVVFGGILLLLFVVVPLTAYYRARKEQMAQE